MKPTASCGIVVFDYKKMPKRAWKERSKLFVAGLIMGATAFDKLNTEGKNSIRIETSNLVVMKQPLTYVEILYMDDTIRISHVCQTTTA